MSLKINLSIDQPEEVQNFFIINTTSFLKDFGFDESTREYIENRITSYNVCYTKLLRYFRP